MWLLIKGALFFDALNARWEKPSLPRKIASSLVFIFILSMGLALLKGFHLLPPTLDKVIPENTFFPIHLAFALVLGVEVISLIFSLADSASRAVAKQIEIMALILIRNIFKDISVLNNANDLVFNYNLLWETLALAGGALVLFTCLGIYLRLTKMNNEPVVTAGVQIYIKQKKCISLLLFIAYIVLGIYDMYIIFAKHESSEFFLHFYNLLIFSDILLVLLNQRIMPSFYATFKNSGYAVGTLFMRIALSADPLWSVALSVFATLYVMALAWTTNKFEPTDIEIHTQHKERRRKKY